MREDIEKYVEILDSKIKIYKENKRLNPACVGDIISQLEMCRRDLMAILDGDKRRNNKISY